MFYQIIGRISFLLIFLNILGVLHSQDLNHFIDNNRFLGDDGNTYFYIDYEFPYNELTFINTDKGFNASLEIEISLLYKGKKRVLKTFTNEIITLSKNSTFSNEISFLDRISFGWQKTGYSIQLQFTDLNTEIVKTWTDELILLDKNPLHSDIEFCRSIGHAQSNFLPKYQENGLLYYVTAGHNAFLTHSDSIFVVYELYNEFADKKEKTVRVNYEISAKGKRIYSLDRDIQFAKRKIKIADGFPINNLSKGKYNLTLTFSDLENVKTSICTEFFFVKEFKLKNLRMFTDLKDEYKLLQYFVTSQKLKVWRKSSDKAKNNFLSKFWAENDFIIETEENEFYDLIRDRVNYCNDNFKHHVKGWKTDRGRIYIKNGAPDEIVKKSSNGSIILLNTK